MEKNINNYTLEPCRLFCNIILKEINFKKLKIIDNLNVII